MSVICPHCSHAMNAKTLRAGRFSPRCTKCGQTFLLVVSGEPELSVRSEKIPPAAPVVLPAAFPEATLGGEHAENAEFSVCADIVRSQPGDPVVTQPPGQVAALPPPAARAEATAVESQQPKAKPRRGAEDVLSGALGGYRIERLIGRGGMGAVYLARQVSLDRPVALKVMNRYWASKPNFLVRFTREAYAAAQLVHHNVVQVYDIGSDRGITFFSMEYVQGQSLGDLLKKEGRLNPETVAGYILQAARGLKFAHDRGMIHRDIKPDNLLLNDHGVIKVADLGLVRTPTSEEGELAEPVSDGAAVQINRTSGRSLDSLSGVTHAGQAVGTPAYMAPEQARDATRVDHRADIYSLGCTAYILLTGKPVFEGSTALAVLTRHAHEPPQRPELIAQGVPRGLSDIVMRMIAKKPDDRYPSMDEVIKALEDFLGLHAAGKQAASEAHVRTLEASVRAFEQLPTLRLRQAVLLGFFSICAGFVVALAMFNQWKLASSFVGLGLLSAASYGIVRGWTRRSPVFVTFRDVALSSSVGEWVRFGLGGLLFLGVIYLLGLFWLWLVAGIFGLGLALALHYTLDRRIAAEQARALQKLERLLRGLRLAGLSEDALQEFVARFAGENWEEVFEALFGYEAKLAARPSYSRGPKGWRPRHAAWRDPLVRWLIRYRRRRQEGQQRKHLQAVEQKSLEAQGVTAAAARQQAEQVASAMVQKAAEIKNADAPPLATLMPAQAIIVSAIPADALPVPAIPVQPLPGSPVPVAVEAAAPRANPTPPRRVGVQDLLDVAVIVPQWVPERRKPILPVLLAAPFSSAVRFFVGAGLLLGCLWWLNSRDLLPGSGQLDEQQAYVDLWQKMHQAEPLEVSFIPEKATLAVSSVNAAVAGLLLVISAVWRGWKIGVLTLLGAAVMVAGPVSGLLPEVGPLTPELVGLAGGGAVMLLGFLYGRGT